MTEYGVQDPFCTLIPNSAAPPAAQHLRQSTCEFTQAHSSLRQSPNSRDLHNIPHATLPSHSKVSFGKGPTHLTQNWWEAVGKLQPLAISTASGGAPSKGQGADKRPCDPHRIHIQLVDPAKGGNKGTGSSTWLPRGPSIRPLAFKRVITSPLS